MQTADKTLQCEIALLSLTRMITLYTAFRLKKNAGNDSRNLRKILGITWKDHMTNMKMLSRTGQDIVAERRLWRAGHIIRIPPGWPANHAMSWTPRGIGRQRGSPTKTWQSTFKEDVVDRGVDWNSIRAVATEADGEPLLPIVLSRTGGSKC